MNEMHFLLLSLLFNLRYRRVERRVDAMDTDERRLVEESGFVLEGVLRKHMIVKVGPVMVP